MKLMPENLVLPSRVVHRPGGISCLLPECMAFGGRGILVHGRSAVQNGIVQAILENKPERLEVECLQHIGGEPTLDDVQALRERAARFQPEWMAAVGGGSAIDLAKAVAAVLAGDRPVAEYHDGAPLPDRIPPLIAAPTTAGTGTEATIVTVLTNTRTGVKKSFRHQSLMPRTVILDPSLLRFCPPDVTAASGMDALVQATESFLSKWSTEVSDAFSLHAVRLISTGLPAMFRAYTETAADSLQTGSFLAGIALSNARLGLVHGLAHPLGARFKLPHGLVCAACFLPVLQFNRGADLRKYEALCEAVGSDFETFVSGLTASLGITSPFKGRAIKDRDGIIRETLESGSTAANPRAVTAADIGSLLDMLF